MTRIRDVKTNFTGGEVTPQLLGRGDLRVYENGALKLRNVFIYPTGGAARRAGLAYIDAAAGDGRLIAFEFNSRQTYLLVLTGRRIDIYLHDVHIETLQSPWDEEHIPQIAWTQSADTLLLVHPGLPPKKLVRTGGGFFLQDWLFFEDGHVVHEPFYKFAPSAMTLTPSDTDGVITLSASGAIFEAGHENTRLQLRGRQLLITAVNSPSIVTAQVIEELPNSEATIDWAESAFSSVRGYPATVAFHQDRLVIGGSRDLPNRLWFSQSGDLFNFSLGSGQDSDAIEFAILSDQVNAIRGIFSGRHLQIFTSGAEWMVTGDPLTPQTVQLKRQTRVGSAIERYIPPVTVDGATMFIGRTRQELREFIYTDLEQAYQSTDLALVSKHIITAPVDQDFDARRRLLFIVREDGRFATLTVYRAEQVSAWTLHETQGRVKSVAVVGDNVYVLVARNGAYTIEQFDEDIYLDSALGGESLTPSRSWSGLDHLEGMRVSVLADGVALGEKTVSNGMITLDDTASSVTVGLPYAHIIEPLPPASLGQGGAGRKTRLIEAIFRLENTQSLRLDVGRGLKDVTLRETGEGLLDMPPPFVNGDVRVRALGWQKGGTDPLWRIEQDEPYPCVVLSVSMEMKVND